METKPRAWEAIQLALQHQDAVSERERDYKEAEVVYWQDLEQHPDNGWALVGLAQSLDAQGKLVASVNAQSRFRQAWKDADVQLTSSRF